MVVQDIKNIKSAKGDLRKFGLTVGIALCLFGALFWWRGKDFYIYLIAIGGAFILLGLAVPIVLKPIQKVWMTFAILLGWVMTRVILSILFFVMITPIGFISKLFGKDFLSLKFDKEAGTYWLPKDIDTSSARDYESQF
ncbi:MAG: hypothetical protein JSV33_16150 [bacterium]|nr:MAG: hypothetical protein JSV33_16150 [bacterium]